MEENESTERVYSIIGIDDEHSYSISSLPSSLSEEPELELATTGIFESFSLIPEGTFTVPAGEINFDGFNYTIPFASGDAVEQDNIETLTLPGAYDINTVVEIITTDNEDENETDNECDNDSGLSGVAVGCDKAKKITRSTRRDFIKDSYSRQRYFNEGFQKLAAHLYRAMNRTSCEGVLTAVFEGGILHLSQVPDPTRTDSGTIPVTSEKRPMGGNTESDHPYAATVLMQRVSSPSIKDHQYDEKTTIPVQEIDLEEDNNTGGRKRKRSEHTGYIKTRWARDQTFGKFTRSLFREKAILEDRTGASVLLTLNYERCFINQENYSDVISIVASSRKRVPQTKPRTLAPKPAKPEMKMLPLSFVLPLPTFNKIPNETPFFSSQPTTISLEDSGMDFQFVSSVAEEMDEPFCVIESTKSTAESHLNSSTNQLTTSQHDRQENASQRILNGVPAQSNIANSCDDIIHLSAGEECDPDRNRPKSPIVTSKAFKDSANGTEPTCSTCHVTTPANLNGPTYWIRCNDAFCYDMVHASCVGFMISCKSHLRQLPPYYCRTHRAT